MSEDGKDATKPEYVAQSAKAAKENKFDGNKLFTFANLASFRLRSRQAWREKIRSPYRIKMEE